MSDAEELAERVNKFNALKLPGQPLIMHMGTSYLVNDLWEEVKRLRSLVREPEGIVDDIEVVRAHAQAVLDYADNNLTMMEAADCPTNEAEKIFEAAKFLVEAFK